MTEVRAWNLSKGVKYSSNTEYLVLKWWLIGGEGKATSIRRAVFFNTKALYLLWWIIVRLGVSCKTITRTRTNSRVVVLGWHIQSFVQGYTLNLKGHHNPPKKKWKDNARRNSKSPKKFDSNPKLIFWDFKVFFFFLYFLGHSGALERWSGGGKRTPYVTWSYIQPFVWGSKLNLRWYQNNNKRQEETLEFKENNFDPTLYVLKILNFRIFLYVVVVVVLFLFVYWALGCTQTTIRVMELGDKNLSTISGVLNFPRNPNTCLRYSSPSCSVWQNMYETSRSFSIT